MNIFQADKIISAAAVDNHRCPTCYVSAGRKCVTVHGNRPTSTHTARLLAAVGA